MYGFEQETNSNNVTEHLPIQCDFPKWNHCGFMREQYLVANKSDSTQIWWQINQQSVSDLLFIEESENNALFISAKVIKFLNHNNFP